MSDTSLLQAMLAAKAVSGGGGGGGFTPTTAQLAAMNSGITAEKLQEDENNISLRTGFGTQIPNNTNLNNLTTIGTYYVTAYSGAATLTNLPITSSGRLVVSALNTDSNNRLIQTFYPTWNDPERTGIFYMRHLATNDGWTSWYLFTGTVVS